jgi:hypothetical protein
MPESRTLWKGVGLHSAVFWNALLQPLGLHLVGRAKWPWSAKVGLAKVRANTKLAGTQQKGSEMSFTESKAKVNWLSTTRSKKAPSRGALWAETSSPAWTFPLALPMRS